MAGRYATALRHRDLRLLLLSFLIDAGGSWASTTVLTVYVFESTRSLALLALFPSSRWVTGLLAAPLAGIIADRFDRRRLMICSALLTGTLVSALTVAVAVHAAIPVILLLQVLATLTSSPYQPAAGALTPQVVDEGSLPTANGLFAVLENLVLVLGPAVGGALVLLREPAIGIGVNAASFFVAAALAAALRVRSRGDAGSGQRLARQFLDGVTALRSTPTAAVLLLFVALDTLLAGSCTVLYVLVGQHAGLGDGGYGVLLAASAIGGVLGALLADRLSSARRLAGVILGGMLLQALPFAATALTTAAPLIVALQLLSGAGMVMVDVLGMTAIQREVASGSLSRVLGLLQMIGLTASIVGSFTASALISAATYRGGLIVLGAGVAVLAMLLTPMLVRIDRRSAAQTALLGSRAAVMAQLPLFATLPRTTLERLATRIELRRFAAGEELIREGDGADALWILVEGHLRITASTRRDGALPDVVAPDVVGEIGVLHARPRTATVTALDAATLWRLSGTDFLDGLEPSRIPTLLLGAPAIRLSRTHPDAV